MKGPSTRIPPYPASASARDRFVVERRGRRSAHDPWRHQGLIVEDERTAEGTQGRVATVFLTGRECPWRCAMCDLWRFTTPADTPAGSIPKQIAGAVAALNKAQPPPTVIKLYNAGSFFDPRAVPVEDYEDIARLLGGFSRVVVESHPALIGPRVDRLVEALGRHAGPHEPSAALEVAMGLETAHPEALDRLNKHFTLARFEDAARGLSRRGVTLRVFLLISPPFVAAAEQDDWLLRSVDTAFDCGASVVSLVPTRPGNGTMEALAAAGMFRQPDLNDIERSFALVLSRAARRGRLFVDCWDLDRFASCTSCLSARRERLHRMNLQQQILPAWSCGHCSPATDS
jgi:radical SAM enzyme (TIGR01210 family)